jgi:hypothetical protein
MEPRVGLGNRGAGCAPSLEPAFEIPHALRKPVGKVSAPEPPEDKS